MSLHRRDRRAAWNGSLTARRRSTRRHGRPGGPPGLVPFYPPGGEPEGRGCEAFHRFPRPRAGVSRCDQLMPARLKHCLPEIELAALAGVSASTWRTHQAQGAPLPNSKGRLEAWLKAYHAWRQRNGKGAPGATGGAAPDPEHARARRELAGYRAMLAKLQVAERTKMLIPRAEVVDTVARALEVVTSVLHKAVDDLVTDCAGAGADQLRHQLDVAFTALLAQIEQRFQAEGNRGDKTSERSGAGAAEQDAGDAPAEDDVA